MKVGRKEDKEDRSRNSIQDDEETGRIETGRTRKSWRAHSRRWYMYEVKRVCGLEKGRHHSFAKADSYVGGRGRSSGAEREGGGAGLVRKSQV